jgi:hypothetical protein
MSAMAVGMKMAEPDCTASPTAQQQRAVVGLVNETVTGRARDGGADPPK